MIPVSFVKLMDSYEVSLFLSIGKPHMTPELYCQEYRIICQDTRKSYEVFRLGHQLGSTFTGTDRNGPNYHIGPELSHRSRLCGSCIAAIAG